MATVKFSEDIMVPKNYTQFNGSVLNVTLTPGSESNKSRLGFSWNVSEITQTVMTLKLEFEYPLEVSSQVSLQYFLTFILVFRLSFSDFHSEFLLPEFILPAANCL